MWVKPKVAVSPTGKYAVEPNPQQRQNIKTQQIPTVKKLDSLQHQLCATLVKIFGE
ncbi:hypothetical protein H6G64_03590 [Calothrix sp. FACHB-156]|nr:hypothetical protein [Calothrix sp. FACHB-156]